MTAGRASLWDAGAFCHAHGGRATCPQTVAVAVCFDECAKETKTIEYFDKLLRRILALS
jgi:hypothetical protein